MFNMLIQVSGLKQFFLLNSTYLPHIWLTMIRDLHCCGSQAFTYIINIKCLEIRAWLKGTLINSMHHIQYMSFICELKTNIKCRPMTV